MIFQTDVEQIQTSPISLEKQLFMLLRRRKEKERARERETQIEIQHDNNKQDRLIG